MDGQWYYVDNGAPAGPVSADSLLRLAADGTVQATTYVWQEGMTSWLPAGEVPGLLPPPPPPPLGMPPPAVPPPSGRSILGEIGVGISRAAEVPTLSGVPIREVLLGGLQLQPGMTISHIEDLFAVGTESTTPPLAAVPSGWPTPRVFWRIFFGAIGIYLLLLAGLRQFNNIHFVPGMIVIGSFVVPLSVVVLFFELNVPRNVSIYQVAKMILLGGALSLLVTLVVGEIVPFDGVGHVIPAMLTGVVEEVGKALVLFLLIGSLRYPYQLNGLLFGAAVGAGFAGFESAGYAFRLLIETSTVDAATSNILLRGLLAPGGHVIWTAMIASALWKVKGDRRFEVSMLFHPVVIRRFLVAVVLHGLWDTDVWLIPGILWCVLLLVVGWYIVFGILKQALAEVEAAKQAAVAAQPAAATVLSIVR